MKEKHISWGRGGVFCLYDDVNGSGTGGAD